MHSRYDPSDDEGMQDPEEPDHSDSEDAADATEKKFRFNGKNLGLTYSQCDLELKEVIDGFQTMADKLGITKLVVGQEEHASNGGRHFHIYIHFAKKFDTYNVRYFDINAHEMENGRDTGKVKTYHPNWKKFPKDARNAVVKWIYYCMKEGKFHKQGFMDNLFLFKDGTNYTKKKADHEAWIRDAEDQGLDEPFPFNLPDGFQITEPTLAYRKRHWLILGKPDAGKTYWADRTFKGKRVFDRATEKTDTPYELGDYKGAKLIIWDDVIPKLNELIAVANGAGGRRKKTYGRSRYTNNYWKVDQAQTIIWLLNPSRLPEWAKPWHKDYDIFQSRFNILAYENGQWVDRIDTVDVQAQQPGVWINPG